MLNYYDAPWNPQLHDRDGVEGYVRIVVCVSTAPR